MNAAYDINNSKFKIYLKEPLISKFYFNIESSKLWKSEKISIEEMPNRAKLNNMQEQQSLIQIMHIFKTSAF